MKTFVKAAFLTLALSLLVTAKSDAQFRNHGMWLGPVLTLTDPIGFGAQLEYGVSDNVGIGGILRYYSKSYSYIGYDVSWTVIMPQFQAAYHFMPGDQLDPYAGGRLGWAIFSWDNDRVSEPYSSGLFLTAYGGLRYFFTPKVAGNGSLEFRVAGDEFMSSALQISLGVDFTL